MTAAAALIKGCLSKLNALKSDTATGSRLCVAHYIIEFSD